MGDFIEKYSLHTVLLILIFCFAVFIRFYKLGEIPKGLYPDETAIGYNAYSILQTGKDEYGVSYPLYFRSFDDYKMPVYVYLTSLSIKAFGLNSFTVRFPSAFLGSIAIIVIFFLIYELSENKWLALIASFSLALNPWHIFFSRTGYEVNVATSLLIIGTLFFVMAIKRKNNFFLFILSLAAFILSLYTYNVTRVVSPLIFFILIALHFKQLTIHSKKKLIILLAFFFIGMLPFLITLFTLQSNPGFAAQNDALITGRAEKAEILQTRSYFVDLPNILQKTLFNYWFLVLWKFINNIVSFFSTSFFFTSGAERPNENIGEFGMFYYFDFFIIIIGAYQGIKQKKTFLYPFYLWFLVMLFVGAIIVPIPNNSFGTRTYASIIPLIVFSSFGLLYLAKVIIAIKKSLFRNILIFTSLAFLLYSYVFYLTSYFFRFPIEYAKEWHAEDQDVVSYIMQTSKSYKKIIFDDSSGFNYSSLLFYSHYPPLLHQQQAMYIPKGLVTTVAEDGKFEFRTVDWIKDIHQPQTLFITGKNNTPSNLKPLAIFYYPTRPVVFFYERKIAQYPTTDSAYEIFQSVK